MVEHFIIELHTPRRSQVDMLRALRLQWLESCLPGAYADAHFKTPPNVGQGSTPGHPRRGRLPKHSGPRSCWSVF